MGPAPSAPRCPMIQIKDHEMQQLSAFVQERFGIRLIEKRNLVEGRLTKLLTDRGINSFSEYFQTVVSDKTGSEILLLMDRLTTNHTFFMREASHFDYFRSHVLPWLEQVSRERDVRIWSAGCSSGEEPYTLAMILTDYFGKGAGGWDLRILATDISASVLDSARRGEYTGEEVRTLPRPWQLSYFNQLPGDRFQVCEGIRNQVIFRSFNLMEPVLPFKRPFHVIFCRNVMIYFDQETKNQLIQRYYNGTLGGGYLFIGHSESLGRDSMGYRYVLPSVYRKD